MILSGTRITTPPPTRVDAARVAIADDEEEEDDEDEDEDEASADDSAAALPPPRVGKSCFGSTMRAFSLSRLRNAFCSESTAWMYSNSCTEFSYLATGVS